MGLARRPGELLKVHASKGGAARFHAEAYGKVLQVERASKMLCAGPRRTEATAGQRPRALVAAGKRGFACQQSTVHGREGEKDRSGNFSGEAPHLHPCFCAIPKLLLLGGCCGWKTRRHRDAQG